MVAKDFLNLLKYFLGNILSIFIIKINSTHKNTPQALGDFLDPHSLTIFCFISQIVGFCL